MTPASPWRLPLALTTSGLLLALTAAGPWAFSPSGFLWAVPLLIAGRCLPLPLALPLVLVVTAIGRFFALRLEPSLDGALTAGAAAALLLPALMVDRLAIHRWPLAGNLAWPLAITTTVLAAGASLAGSIAAPVPAVDATALVSAALHPTAAVFVVAVVAQGIAGLGTVHNWRVPDRIPQLERERGARVGAIVASLVLAGVVIVGLLHG